MDFVKSLVQKVPKGFYSDKLTSRSKDVNRPIANSYAIEDKNDIPAIYVFNYSDGGFALISADDRHEPLLTIQDTGSLNVNDTIPGGMNQWLLTTVEHIEILRDNLYDNTTKAHKLWWHFINEVGAQSAIIPDSIPTILGAPCVGCVTPACTQSEYSYGPLISTTWGQLCEYNDSCPDLDCGSCDKAPTGCVATAMAQLIRYWQCKNITIINCLQYYRSNATYNYIAMPNDHGNNHIQSLMKETGMNVCMDYGCDGSGTSSSIAFDALKYRYGFTNASLENYGGFVSQFSSDLGNGRPILMTGCSIRKKKWFYVTYDVCHMWICDGMRGKYYSDCTDWHQLHMNWGWDGEKNGWYLYNDWYIPGYNLNFKYANEIIKNLYLNY